MDLEKFICSLIKYHKPITEIEICSALKDQGLEYKGGAIVEIGQEKKSRFKVGDWVTDGVSKCQICFIDDTQYWYSKNCILGNIESIDKRYHLWTIQDAKDGDVLVKDIYPYGMSICLFKEFNSQLFTMKLYCSVDRKGQFLHNHCAYYHRYDVTLYPATKEQHDALEKAMTDAGYTFDFEKKELKKIEPKFEIGDLITNGILVGKIDEIHEWGYHAYFGDHYADVPDIENWHKWTIEDTKNGDVLSYRDGQWIFIYKEKIDDSSFYYHTLYSTIHQDLTINDSAFTLLGDAIIPATKKQRYLLFQKMKESGYEFDFGKKELKEIVQSSTEWSEEDERLFQIVIDVLDRQNHLGNISHTDLIACVRKLKSLRPKKQWKPSEEQMKGLRWVFEFCNTSHQTNVLKELYEQLKQL